MRQPKFIENDWPEEEIQYYVCIEPNASIASGPHDDYMDALITGLKAQERISSELYIMRVHEHD